MKIAGATKKLENLMMALSSTPATKFPCNSTSVMTRPGKFSQAMGRRLKTTRRRLTDPLVLRESVHRQADKVDTLKDLRVPPSDPASVLLWHQENGWIDMVSPTCEDITISLIYTRRLLLAAIEDAFASGLLLLPGENGKWLITVIDQLLAQSHLAAAASLQCENQPWVSTAKRLTTALSWSGFLDPASLDRDNSRASIDDPAESAVQAGEASVARDLLPDSVMKIFKGFVKRSPWGVLKIDLVLLGSPLASDVLCFGLTYTPVSQALDVGVSIQYMSYRMDTLFTRVCPSLCPRDSKHFTPGVRFRVSFRFDASSAQTLKFTGPVWKHLDRHEILNHITQTELLIMVEIRLDGSIILCPTSRPKLLQDSVRGLVVNPGSTLWRLLLGTFKNLYTPDDIRLRLFRDCWPLLFEIAYEDCVLEPMGVPRNGKRG